MSYEKKRISKSKYKYDCPPPYSTNSFYSSISPVSNNIIDRSTSNHSNLYGNSRKDYEGYPINNQVLNKSNKSNKSNRVVRYHGPIINSEPQGKKIIHVVKKFQGKVISSTYFPFPENNHIPVYTEVDSRVAVPGASMVPLVITNRNQMSEYFREQERLMENRHLDEKLRLEAQKVYTNLIRKY